MPKEENFDTLPAIEWTPVSVRFTSSEHAQIKRAAKRRGLSFNTFIRQISQITAERVLQEASSPDEELRRITLGEVTRKPTSRRTVSP